jgi:DNA repair photolyase
MPGDDDDRPIETSARKPVKAHAALEAIASVIKPVKRRVTATATNTRDPRFDKMVSKINPNAAEHHYGFMQDLATAELSSARWRFKHIRRELHRRAKEAAAREAGEDDVSSSSGASSSSEEDADDGQHASGLRYQVRQDAKVRYGLLPEHVLRKEGAELKASLAKHKSLAGDAAARARQAKARREHLKREVEAVESGKKSKAFFLKRGDQQRLQAAEHFDAMGSRDYKGRIDLGRVKAAAERYNEKKDVRRVRGTQR